MKKSDWIWGPHKGNPELGDPAEFTMQTSDGFEIIVTLQQNVDGVLVCSGLTIQFIKKEISAPLNPINSRYFQQLGFGEILASARMAYIEQAKFLNEVLSEIDFEQELVDWTAQGPEGFPDKKYAALAYFYVAFVGQGLENPIALIADKFGKEGEKDGDRNTWSKRIMEARRRELLTKPKVGKVGGRLTPKAKKLLDLNQPQEINRRSNAKKNK